MRSPDVSFIKMDHWKAIPLEKRKNFLPFCPDFIAELRSESDILERLKLKMREWMGNGCKLAWLIDHLEEKAYIYRPSTEVEIVDNFNRVLLGEDILPGFQLQLSEIINEI